MVELDDGVAHRVPCSDFDRVVPRRAQTALPFRIANARRLEARGAVREPPRRIVHTVATMRVRRRAKRPPRWDDFATAVQPRSRWMDRRRRCGPTRSTARVRPPLDGDSLGRRCDRRRGVHGVVDGVLVAPGRSVAAGARRRRETVGFGASGRNGGWCVGELAGGLDGGDRDVRA